MKKTLALILAILVAVSMFSFATFAADGKVTIIFVNDGAEYSKVEVPEGVDVGIYVPENPSKAPTDKAEYIFKGWQNLNGGDIYVNDFPAATEDATYIAVYSEKEIKETQSFWNFIESIFARINLIFEYFAAIFDFSND